MRGERYLKPMAVVSVGLALGATACGGNQLKTSPAAYSKAGAYPGDPNAHGTDPIYWPDAVVADVQLPEPINADVIIGFEKPGTDDWTVKDFPTGPTQSGEFLLRLGRGPVEFEIQLRSKNSNITKVAPKVTFKGPEPVAVAKKIPGIRLGGATGWKHLKHS